MSRQARKTHEMQETEMKDARGPAPTSSALPVIALVTAYNEAETIGDVIAALQACPAIDRIHVVDDASEDDTRAIALAAGVAVTSLPVRVPVGQAIMHHLDAVPDEALFVWCDADLTGLAPDHISRLVRRYHEGGVSQSLSSRALPLNWFAPFRTAPFRWGWKTLFGPISGERVMLRSFFADAVNLASRLGWSEMMRGYGIVLFLNWYSNAFAEGHAVTYIEGLRQRQKYQKWGAAAFILMVRQWAQFILVWGKIRLNARRIRTLKAEAVAAGDIDTRRSNGPAAINP